MKKLLVIFSLAGVFLLFACSQPPLLINITPTIIRHPTSTLTLSNTLEPPKIAAWSFEPDGENDGKISLTISDVSGGCHPLGQPIQIRMSLRNLTDDPLTIPEIFQISTNYDASPVDIIARLKPADNDEIYAVMESTREIDIISRIPTPSAYHELPAHNMLEKIVEYKTRPEIRLYDNKTKMGYFFPIGPGRYVLKFGYTLSHFNSQGKWYNWIGFAISNRIEICLK